jgi:Tol biopolymer transport system component
MRKVLVLACVALASVSVSSQTKRPATFDDVLHLKAVQGATVSPDGSQVIYTVRQWESEQDPSTPVAETQPSLRTSKMEGRTRVWKVATSGSSPARQITFGEKGDSQPQWSPDGRYISFVSSRGGAEAKAQIYLMHADGGEAWKLTDAKEGVAGGGFGGAGYSWSPDGTRIAYTSTAPRSAEDVDADHRRRHLHGAGRAVMVARRQAVRVCRRDYANAARQSARHLRRDPRR